VEKEGNFSSLVLRQPGKGKTLGGGEGEGGKDSIEINPGKRKGCVYFPLFTFFMQKPMFH
jgi:hypothetical protein